MRDTLLEASGDRPGVLVWNVGSLVAAGLGERARASARLSAGRTVAEAAKLASVLYACLWLTAGFGVLIERDGWRHAPAVSVCMVGLLVVVLAWSLGRQRLAGVTGLACTVAAVLVTRRRDLLPPVSFVQPMLPAFGFLIMAIAPRRERPSTVAVAALAALVVVSVVVPGGHTGGFSQFIVLATASIAGLAVFAVQPRLAIAVAIIWTAIGIGLIAFTSPQPAPWKLLVATAPAVLAATAARARVIRRRAT
jgi:drug/metabolite transporter (DMT)-like permease